MTHEPAFDKCRTFIHCHLQSAKSPHYQPPLEPRSITFSRQTGSGALTIAHRLAEYLQQQDTEAHCPWTVFDRNLVEKVLEDHHLPKGLAQFMKEKRISEIDNAVEELLGLHPSQWTLVEHTTDTILRLAEAGNVILVGRGANIITRHLKGAFHVRLVASPEKRLEHVIEFYHLDRSQALEFMQIEDRNRERYLRKYFGKSLDDPLLYHLTINTDWIPYEEAARLIGDAVLRRGSGE